MEVLVREVANIHLSNSAFSTTHFLMAQLPSNMDININYNIIRERPTFSNKAISRDLLISSSISFISYAQCMEMNNDLLDIKIWDLINSSQLFYKRNVEVGDLISKATNNFSQRKGNMYEMRYWPSRPHLSHKVKVCPLITLTRVCYRTHSIFNYHII